MKHSIAIKIFSLPVGVLLIAFVVSCYTNIEIMGLSKDIDIVANNFMPLAITAAKIDECGLEKRIAFQTLYGEYNETNRNLKLIENESRKLEQEEKCYYENLEQLRGKLLSLPNDPEERELIVKARELSAEMEAVFTNEVIVGKKILENRQKGDWEKAKDLMVFDQISEDQLDEHGAQIQEILFQLVNVAAKRAKETEARVLWSSVITGLCSLLAGMAIAWMISRSLAEPIAALLKRTLAVQKGDLTAHSGNFPADEIGQLGENFNKMVNELRRKQNMQTAIGSYIDPRIVEKIIVDGKGEEAVAQKRIMTVHFTDMAGFSTLGERLTPGGLVNILNRYFDLMSQCIRNENGVIDKFIGDAIMAYYGAPFVSEETQGLAACRAAIAQMEALKVFQKELPDLMGIRKGVPTVSIRTGIATGEVIVGNIGSTTTRSYTVMGDTVNLASRLESVNKVYGTEMILNEDCYRIAEREFEMRELDRITVYGKSDPVRIYELLTSYGQLDPMRTELCAAYASALNLYRKQEWDKAIEGFQTCLRIQQDDGPSLEILNRIIFLKKNPPPNDWDGVWQNPTK